MSMVSTVDNPELEVIDGNLARWFHADNRRWGFHNLHKLARYSMSLRSPRVMRLEKRFDLRIADLEPVRHLISLPCFSAMVVVRGQHVLFERYASDFGKDRPHSIQSITKTTVHLMAGRLVEAGVLDLSRPVSQYIPEIGSGYAHATVQQVLNMDIANDYSEDFADPNATYYRHEEAMGWRLPREAGQEHTQRSFLVTIKSDDIVNRSGQTQYKDANTDVLGWVLERASNRPLRSLLADIVDGAGLEGAFHITTDRDGVPALDGGACVTARDLARYMSLFVRAGRGVRGEAVASAAFIEHSMKSGVPMSPKYEGMRYSNHLLVSGCTLGHGGWGGQYAMVNLDTGVIGIFFSVKEDERAATPGYIQPVIRMLNLVTGPEYNSNDHRR